MGTLATQMRSTIKYNCVASQYSVNKSPVQDASRPWPSWIFLQSQFNTVKKMIGSCVQCWVRSLYIVKDEKNSRNGRLSGTYQCHKIKDIMTISGNVCFQCIRQGRSAIWTFNSLPLHNRWLWSILRRWWRETLPGRHFEDVVWCIVSWELYSPVLFTIQLFLL